MISTQQLSESRKELLKAREELKELRKPNTSPEVLKAIREQIKKDRELKVLFTILFLKLRKVNQ